MKLPQAILIVSALVVCSEPVFAKVTSGTQSDNERVMNTVAGPAPSNPTPKSNAQPSKKELKKARIKPKPPLNDPN